MRRLCFYRCLSVHGGVGCLPQCMLGYHPPSRSPLQKQTPRPPPRADTLPPPRADEQTSPGADTPQRADPPQKETPKSRHPQRAETPSQEQTPLPPLRADIPPTRVDTPPPRYGHCCGRYASYWNAFLCSDKFGSERGNAGSSSSYSFFFLLQTTTTVHQTNGAQSSRYSGLYHWCPTRVWSTPSRVQSVPSSASTIQPEHTTIQQSVPPSMNSTNHRRNHHDGATSGEPSQATGRGFYCASNATW